MLILKLKHIEINNLFYFVKTTKLISSIIKNQFPFMKMSNLSDKLLYHLINDPRESLKLVTEEQQVFFHVLTAISIGTEFLLWNAEICAFIQFSFFGKEINVFWLMNNPPTFFIGRCIDKWCVLKEIYKRKYKTFVVYILITNLSVIMD